jgi:hypothetical protein
MILQAMLMNEDGRAAQLQGLELGSPDFEHWIKYGNYANSGGSTSGDFIMSDEMMAEPGGDARFPSVQGGLAWLDSNNEAGERGGGPRAGSTEGSTGGYTADVFPGGHTESCALDHGLSELQQTLQLGRHAVMEAGHCAEEVFESPEQEGRQQLSWVEDRMMAKVLVEDLGMSREDVESENEEHIVL